MAQALHIVVAIDSFKGSATSMQAATWVADGIHRVDAQAQVTKVPIADGGEGTVEALTSALGGKKVSQMVTGPLGDQVQATFGLLDDTTAVIEMAQSSGLNLTAAMPDDALRASTYGVGELIKGAMDAGAKTIYLGLGGSATTDGGVGMAKALGAAFYTERGTPIACGAQGLAQLHHIDVSQLDARLAQVSIKILSDVTNPLCGPEGAAAIYGPQKGLTPEQIPIVDSWLQHLGDLLEQATGRLVADQPGAGAAGGLGAGLLALTKAKVYRGIEEILRMVHLDEALAHADLVITGEGRMDAQSLNGKAPIGIAKAAKQHALPVVALVGARSDDLGPVYQAGIDVVWAIMNHPQTLAEAIQTVQTNLTTAGETAVRAYLMTQTKGD